MPSPFWVTKQAECDHRDVDVTTGKSQLDCRSVRIMITRIKIDFGDLAAKVLQLSRGCGTPLAGPGGKHDT